MGARVAPFLFYSLCVWQINDLQHATRRDARVDQIPSPCGRLIHNRNLWVCLSLLSGATGIQPSPLSLGTYANHLNSLGPPRLSVPSTYTSRLPTAPQPVDAAQSFCLGLLRLLLCATRVKPLNVAAIVTIVAEAECWPARVPAAIASTHSDPLRLLGVRRYFHARVAVILAQGVAAFNLLPSPRSMRLRTLPSHFSASPARTPPGAGLCRRRDADGSRSRTPQRSAKHPHAATR